MAHSWFRFGSTALAGLVLAGSLVALGGASPASAAPTSPVVINEVESNGGTPGDWVELANPSAAAADVSGFVLRDNDDSDGYAIPAGTTIAAGGYLTLDEADFGFGLGGSDSARLFEPDGTTLVDSYTWTSHATTTYGRCPDMTGDFATTLASTKNAANSCAGSTPPPPATSTVRINEVESNGGTPGDWVELTNVGATTADIGGYVFRDDDDSHSYVIPAGTTVAPGGFTVLDEAVGDAPGFDFGLGAPDSARLFLPDGTTVVDQYSWTTHAGVTYGRNPDGTGGFAATSESTKGAANVFGGTVDASPWPGGPDEKTLDAEGLYTEDFSGLDYEPSGTRADGTLWGVVNGTGTLEKIVSDGKGGWAPTTADGWANGKALHYTDGTGVPDAEGVTVADNSSAGGVYVSSERNGDADDVSRPSILRYDVSGSATSLTATDEWNLAPDFPGLGANSGAEGVTFIPDSFLTAGGFDDQQTGAAYDPADYAGHGDGLFFVGIEGTASVYAYALMPGGAFERVATITTPFPIVADVQFDSSTGNLWVICDDACDGRTATYQLGSTGAFTQTALYDPPTNADPAYANEGFAIADAATCTSDGTRLTFYADDNDTDGFSFREGTLPCDPPVSDPGGSGPGGSGPGAPGSGGSAGDGAGAGGAGSGAGAGVGAGAGSTVAADGDPSSLAYTGSNPAPAAVAGGLLLLAGIALTLARRRRAAR